MHLAHQVEVLDHLQAANHHQEVLAQEAQVEALLLKEVTKTIL